MLADLLISPLSSFLLVLLPCRDAAEAVAGRSVCFLQIVYSFVPLSERSCVLEAGPALPVLCRLGDVQHFTQLQVTLEVKCRGLWEYRKAPWRRWCLKEEESCRGIRET